MEGSKCKTYEIWQCAKMLDVDSESPDLSSRTHSKVLVLVEYFLETSVQALLARGRSRGGALSNLASTNAHIQH